MTKRAVKTGNDSKSSSELFPALFHGLVLLVPVFLYIWLRIEPEVEHHAVGPFFYLSRSFFGPFLDRPGGLVEYAAVFFGHLSHFGWLGALVFSLLTVTLFLASRWVLHQVAGITSALPSLTPVLLLLWLRNDYGSPAPAIGLGLLLAIAAIRVWSILGPVHIGFRLSASSIFGVVVLYLAGFWACVFFALMVGLKVSNHSKSSLQGPAGVFLGLLPCLVFLGLANSVTAVKFLDPWESKSIFLLAAALHLLLPIAGSLTLLGRTVHVPAPLHARPTTRHPQLHRLPWYRTSAFYSAVFVLLLVAGMLGLWFTFDEQRKTRAKIDYLASEGEYGGVLALIPKLTAIDASSQIRLHLALYHSGLLSSDLFTYAVPAVPEMLPGIAGGLSTCRAQTQTLFELGLINDAEHLAHEALEFEGDHPDLLRVLAQINVLKGRPKAARVFLNVLHQIPFERQWASTRLRDLESSPLLAADKEVSRIRSCLLTNDLPHSGFPAGAILSRLLMTNPANKMAFEYLLSSYLLDLNLTNALGAVSFLDALGYQAIPRHLEEAVLMHQNLSGALVDLRGRQLSAQTRQRFEQFRDALTRLPDQGPQSRRALVRQFGDTYWCYYVITQANDNTSRGKPPSS